MKCIFVDKKEYQIGMSFRLEYLVNQDGENHVKKGDVVQQTQYKDDEHKLWKVKEVKLLDHYVILTVKKYK